MMNIELDSTIVFRKDFVSERGKDYSMYSIPIPHKSRDGKTTFGYFQVRFAKGAEVPDRAKIKINKAFMNFEGKYAGRDTFSIKVMDFEIIPENEIPKGMENDGSLAFE